MSEYYTKTGTPSTGSLVESAPLRGEFAAIEAGFNKFPAPSANASKILAVNSGGTAIEALEGKDVSGGFTGLTLFKINFKNAANTFISFFTNANTAARTYTFQDRDGTIADAADLALKANLASPTFTGTPTLPTGTIGTTQAAADNTTKLATTAYAMQIGLRSNGFGAYTATATLTAADIGRACYFFHATVDGILTLPLISSVPEGSVISISNIGAANCLVQRNGSNVIYAQGAQAVTAIALSAGQSIILGANTSLNWIQIAGNKNVATETISGDKAFTGIISGAKFQTAFAAQSAGDGVATTLYAIPNAAPAMYLISANIGTTNDPANYSAFAIVAADGTVARLLNQSNGLLNIITLSGLNIQVTQNSGATQVINLTITRIG